MVCYRWMDKWDLISFSAWMPYQDLSTEITGCQTEVGMAVKGLPSQPVTVPQHTADQTHPKMGFILYWDSHPTCMFLKWHFIQQIFDWKVASRDGYILTVTCW